MYKCPIFPKKRLSHRKANKGRSPLVVEPLLIEDFNRELFLESGMIGKFEALCLPRLKTKRCVTNLLRGKFVDKLNILICTLLLPKYKQNHCFLFFYFFRIVDFLFVCFVHE